MNILEQPILLALVAAVPSFILGILAYSRSVKVDRVTEQSGAALAQTGAVNQVIDGLNELIDNLQQDNEILRKGLSDLSVKLERVVAERDELSKQIRALTKKYNIPGTGPLKGS